MKNKRLLYILGANFPSIKAYSIQTVNTVSTLSKKIHTSFWFLSRCRVKNSIIKNNFFKNKNVNIKSIHTGEMLFLHSLNQRIWMLSFYFVFIIKVLFRLIYNRFDYIYTRDELIIHIFDFLKKIGLIRSKVFFEAHSFKNRFLKLKNIDGIACMTSYIKKELINNHNNVKKAVIHDSVDVSKFNIKIDKNIERKRFGLPKNKKIISFIGKTIIYEYEKGIYNIIDSISLLNEDIVLLCVGGPENMYNKYVEYVKNKKYDLKKYIFIDHIEHNKIPQLMNCVDILISYPPDKKVFSEYVSPLKVFEYLATGIPVILSDLPSHREILYKDHGVQLVEPENKESLKEIIEKILNNYSYYRKISMKNIDIARENTWKKRAEKIIDFINGEDIE